jgi:predicted transglutaminase-like cysteine proteinase
MPERVSTLRQTLLGAAFLGYLAALSLHASLYAGAATIRFDRLAMLAEDRYGAGGLALVREWEDFINASRNLPTREQLIATNDFFNTRVRWNTDQNIFGQEDHWATPLETLGRLEADCEDFSIAKYATLLALGVPPESLRLVYVKLRYGGGASQAHMVLAWYETATAVPLILGNFNTRVLRADERGDLTPVFSFNADELWISGTAAASSARPQARISRWRGVLDRMADEGFQGTP